MKFATRFLWMIIGIGDSLGVAQTAVQWRIEDGGNGHWYEAVYSNPPKSPESWFAFATSNGGAVPSITSTSENAGVYSIAWQNGDFIQACIGGKRNSSNVFQWVAGDSWNYTQWSSGEPSCTYEKYLMLSSGGWNDTNTNARS